MYKKLHLILQFSYLRSPSNHHCRSLTVVKFQICALFYISFVRLENKIPAEFLGYLVPYVIKISVALWLCHRFPLVQHMGH